MEGQDVWGYETPRRLVGKVAVVTGGGHGIGKACVWRLAKEGAKVVIAELSAPAASYVARELTQKGELYRSGWNSKRGEPE